MEIHVLGPLLVLADEGSPISLSQQLVRSAICVLVTRAGQPLSREELMDLIWPSVPSAGALRTCLYEVRRVLGAERLIRQGGDYRLVLSPTDRTDLAAFRQSADAGERALSTGQRRKAIRLFTDALALWRDPALKDFPGTAAAQNVAARLIQERARVRDDLVEAKFATGDLRDLVNILETKTADEPLNEQGWGQLMLALHRSGRTGEALRAYERACVILDAEAGADPGPELQQLRRMVNYRDPALNFSGEAIGAAQVLPLPLPLLSQTPRVPPTNIDVTKPNVARMYDFFLGGKNNFAADREAANKVIDAAPQAPALARENRAFIGRAVRYLTQAGIRQFIDIGSGLPTRENVHEVAQRAASDARVAYVDNDPVVLSHSRALLATDNQTLVIEADMRRPGDILDHRALREVIDLGQPVAVLFTSTLHLIADDEGPAEIVAHVRDRIAPGSYVVISHTTPETSAEEARQGAQVYARASSTTQTLRDRDQILRFFDGFDLIPPGLVPLPDWRPDLLPAPRQRRTDKPLPVWFLGGVGRKT